VTTPLTLQTPAKVNFVLEVLGQRSDGFHELSVIFQTIALFDELDISKSDSGVHLQILESPEPLAGDDSNLIVKAARLFFREVLGRESDVLIRLKKRIPLAAGLGGGSSDAACVLIGLNQLYGAKAAPPLLESLAAQLGSDVPFFLHGGTALGTGRGEILTPLEAAPEMSLVLVKPVKGLSTPAVYRSGKALISSGERTRNFKGLLLEKNPHKIADSLFNSLQPAAFYLMPEVKEIREELIKAGALGALVSGSGPTVFGIAESDNAAGRIADRMRKKNRLVLVTRTIGAGVSEIRNFKK